MYFITTKRMLEVCFSAHPNIQYRTFLYIRFKYRAAYFELPYILSFYHISTDKVKEYFS